MVRTDSVESYSIERIMMTSKGAGPTLWNESTGGSQMNEWDTFLKRLRNEDLPPERQTLFREPRLEKIPSLTVEEYASELCAAMAAYNYPSVTCYDFDAFLRHGGYVPYEEKHLNMESVDHVIGKQLTSQDLQEIEDGLSNVLFWGYANFNQFQRSKIQRLRKEITCQQLIDLRDAIGDVDEIDLSVIRSMKIPEFGQMSFASKLLMFLSAGTRPVLDIKIAKFARWFKIPPLSNLKLSWDEKSIPLSNKENIVIYEWWSSWCSTTASRVNDEPSSTCKNLRAVDVERAIFWQIREANNSKARSLLKGPETRIEYD